MAALPLCLAGCLVQQQIRQEQPLDEVAIAAAEPEGLPEPAAESCLPERDLWSHLRQGFALEGWDHPRVDPHFAWYLRHPAYLDRVTERARPYFHLVMEQAKARGIPTEIALLPIVESAFQPFAYSHGRAAGLWQFIPGTGRRFGLKQTWWYDGRRDVVESTRAALDYLTYLQQHFDGDWLLALAAYNSGEGTVKRAIRNNRRRGKGTDFWSLSLPRETRDYVPKLLAVAKLVDNPPAFGFEFDSIDDGPQLVSVDVGSQIDMALAAELADISLEEIYRFNPAFNRWATDPNGPHRLLVPTAKADTFKSKLAKYPPAKRIKWARHTIRSGESIGLIAERYRTTVKLLKEVNRLPGNTIRAGDTLVIPVARKDLRRYTLTEVARTQATRNRQRDGHRINHTVQDGDTLWGIAQKYRVGVRELARWNAMAPRDTLKPGTKLVIWSSVPQQSSAVNPAGFTHPFSNHQRIGYKVRRGDSLARIAQRFKVTVAQLMRWNNLRAGQYLQPGQRLTLYVDVTRQAGKS